MSMAVVRTDPRDEAVLLLPRPRYLIVVSRQHHELYDFLVERFQDDNKVEVVLDRRGATLGRSGDDGASDRRQRRSVEYDLTRRSHLIITRTDRVPRRGTPPGRRPLQLRRQPAA